MTARSCPSEGELCDLGAGRLARDAAARLDVHLDDCTTCRLLVSELGKLAPERPRALRLGRYQLGDVIATGGMGVVHDAFDPLLGRQLAIKILDSACNGGPDELVEARALAAVRHPNVVAVHDVGIVDGRTFIAMEHVVGDQLDRWARGRSWREVLDVMIGAARGLAAIHAERLTHGDIKPSNVLVGHDGRAQLIDFGLAAVARHDAQPIGGTPGFIAPELLEGAPLSYAADQYSFCVTFHAVQPAAMPRAIRRVIARGRHVDPARRHADMTTLLERLERATRPRIFRLVHATTLIALALAFAADGPASSEAAAPSPLGLEPSLHELDLADRLAPMVFGNHPGSSNDPAAVARDAVTEVAAASAGCITAAIDGTTVTYRADACVVGGFTVAGEIVVHYRDGVEASVDATNLELGGARIRAQLAATLDPSGRVSIDVVQTGRGPRGRKLESTRHLVRTIDGPCSDVDATWSVLIGTTRWTGVASGYRTCPGAAATLRALDFGTPATSRTHASAGADGLVHWSSGQASGTYRPRG
jgi:hypothetical protein